MNKNRDIYFETINTVFHAIEFKNHFYERCNIKPNENIHHFLLKYYIYMNTNEKTAIPIKIYLNITSILFSKLHSNGNVYICPNCQYYSIFTTNRKHPIIYGIQPNNSESVIYHYITKFAKFNHLIQTQSNYYDIFLLLHTHHSKLCHNIQFKQYITYKSSKYKYIQQYQQLQQIIQLSQITDKICQIKNWLLIIWNNFHYPIVLYDQICHQSISYIQTHKKSNYYLIFAYYTGKILRNKYENISFRTIANMFGIQTLTLKSYIKVHQSKKEKKKE